MKRFTAVVAVLFSTVVWNNSALADELAIQIDGKARPQNSQSWLSVCLLNRADANLEADLQFSYQAKPEKWKTYKVSDGGALIIGQTFLDDLGAPKVWVKYGNEESGWTQALDGKVTKFRPRRCEDTQRAAFVEETDGNLTLKVLP